MTNRKIKINDSTEVTVNRFWSISSVRDMCIKNNLYTCGDNDEYEHMLSLVRRLYPNVENIYFVAENICKHSKEQTITNVMYMLENEAVTTTFEINGEEE